MSVVYEDVLFIQGDVVLRKIKSIPPEAILITDDVKILQQSEVTGHHHQFRPESRVQLYLVPPEVVPGVATITPNKGKLIRVLETSELFHGKLFKQDPAKDGSGDHKSFLVPPGDYVVDIVREFCYSTMEMGRVVD
jgi:hypothetical protein